MSVITENIPSDLRRLDQWVRWRTETPPGRKPTKIPYDCNGGHQASSTNPETWSSFDIAIEAYQRDGSRYDGVGFVFSKEDDFCGIDLDGCTDESGNLVPEAMDIVKRLDSYTEVSPSGTGVKVFCRGSFPEGFSGRKTESVSFERLEMYSTGRYFTTTGNHLESSPTTVNDSQAGIDWIICRYFTPPPIKNAPPVRPLPPSSVDAKASVESCKQFLLGAPNAITGHGGHDATLYAACECYRFGLSDHEAAQVMQWFNANKTGGEPWTSDEMQHKLADAKKKVAAEGQIGMRAVAEWEDPAPLGERTLPAFPIEALGAVLGEYVEAVAESLQVAIDMPASLALATGAAVLARRFDVHIRSDHYEPLNLYVAVVAEPGERKSAVFREITSPLTSYEIDQAERMAVDVERSATERSILEGAIKSAEGKAARAKDLLERRQIAVEIADLKEQFRQTKAIVSPRILADDVTQERIVGLMQTYGGQIAVMSPEGGVFEQMSGKYSKTAAPNLDIYLKGHAGDDIRVDRIGRAPEWVRNPALTMGLAVQPDVIRGLLSKPALRGRGLLARILYCWPKSRVGYREIDSFGVPESVRTRYERQLLAALRLPIAEPRSTAVQVGPDALDVLDNFAVDVELGLRRDGRLSSIRDWGAKSVGLVCRIAGILHGLKHASDGAPQTIQIDGDTMAAAITIGHYATEHALSTFYEMGSSPDIEQARKILDWLRSEGMTTFTKRQAHRRFESACRTVDEIEAPLELLIKHGHIRPGATERKPTGGRPSEVYDVHPSVSLHKSGET